MNLIPSLTVYLSCLSFLLSLSQSMAAEPRPNVLLICVDDLKPLLGCYGDRISQSPNIDRLAKRGLRFESAYCNQAVCSPSRNALLTGFRTSSLGIYDLGTNFRAANAEIVTLPQHFKQNGYRTEGLGKIFHVGHGNHEDPASWSVPHWKSDVVAYVLPESKAKSSLTREEALFNNTKGVDVQKLPRGAATESADVPDNAYPDGAVADEAIRRLAAAAKNPQQPFFLAVGFVKPHLPFCAPKKYWDLYDRSAFALPALNKPPQGAPSFAPTSWGELRQYAGMPASGPVPDEQALQLIHGYHAATSFMDAQLGRVLDALDQNGLEKNTIIVLWGDHGWHLGDHGMWCKHTNYEQAAHIPLIVIDPKMPAKGVATKSLAESVDIYPTLCDLAGLPKPKGIDGTSFAHVLKDSTAPTKDSILHVYPRGGMIGRAVRTNRYRLVEWKKPGEPTSTAQFELYDYEADPAESKNLAAEQPQVVSTLQAMLANYPEAKPQLKVNPQPSKSAANKKKSQRTERVAMFTKKDKNGDGKLTRDEFLANQPDPDEAPKRFTAFDVDRNGTVDKDEFVTMGRK